jgi:hypothetical protein
MGYASAEVRWAIIAKWKEVGDTGLVAQQLQQPSKVVRRWVQRYRTTGDVANAPKPGRTPLLKGAVAQRAHDLMLSGDAGGAKAVAQLLFTSGDTSKVVDKKTVIRAIHSLGKQRGVKIVALRGAPRKKLTAATMHKRLEFSKSNLARAWGNVLFTDRKKFPFSHPGVKVHAVTWAEEGEQREALTVNHAQVVNAYAGISRYGVTSFHIVAGTSNHKSPYVNKQGKGARNITSSEYTDVVKATFLPEGQRIFSSQGISTWHLQQDNDPTHKAAKPVVQQWNAQHASSVGMVDNWPPGSPDLNPIENFWSHLQEKMDAKGCKTFAEFRAALGKEAKAVPAEYFSRLVGSMPRRLAKCIELGGGKTGY